MLKTKEEIEKWLKKYNITNYSINKDLTVDVNQKVDLSSKYLENIPIKFNKLNGSFNCSYNQLSSLDFCPNIINGHFVCSHNKLTSLEFCPQKINGHFDCSDNNLTNLKFGPKKVKGSFNCSKNSLISLDFLPKKINGFLDISYNKIKKELLYIFSSHVKENIYNDLSNKEGFLTLVQEQKILKEKEEINNNLYSTQNSQLTKKRL